MGEHYLPLLNESHHRSVKPTPTGYWTVPGGMGAPNGFRG